VLAEKQIALRIADLGRCGLRGRLGADIVRLEDVERGGRFRALHVRTVRLPRT